MPLKLALIGSTGLVGQEFLKIWKASQKFGLELDCFASYARPEQNVKAFETLLKESSSYQYFVNAADAKQAEDLLPYLKAGQKLIDNSSAYRMTKEVPLVVPEINGSLVHEGSIVIANPNCTAALLCMCLAPLRKWGLNRVIVSTYQAASGAGIRALSELSSHIQQYATNPTQKLESEVFPFPLFLNVMSHNTAVRTEGEGLGYNDEEWKVIGETKKILSLPNLKISASCLRVPVLRAHTETVTVDLDNEFRLEEIQAVLEKSSGLKWQNDIPKKHFPMPQDAENQDEVFVGRLRRDPFLPQTLHFMLSGDQLRKGAALNAYQILKILCGA